MSDIIRPVGWVKDPLEAAIDAGPFRGWLTCADCSSMGWDTAHGRGVVPKRGECSSCGEPWPKRPQDWKR